MKTIIVSLLIALCAISLCGCTQKKKKNAELETEVHQPVDLTEPIAVIEDTVGQQEEKETPLATEEEGYIPEIMPLPRRVPSDIVDYFRNLEEKGNALPVVRNPELGEEDQIRRTLVELQRYSKGERKFFPLEEVQESMLYLSAYAHYNSGHGNDDHAEIRQVNNYQNHFVAIAAHLCPNLDFMTPLKDADATIGIQQFKDWSSTYIIKSYVFLPKGKGLELQVMDQLDPVMVQKIFRLVDRQGRTYYLFSNDDNRIRFGQVLCLLDKDKLEYVTTFVGLDDNGMNDNIWFNPRTLEWNFCENDESGRPHKIPGAPYVKLNLDGKKSTIKFVRQ